MEEEAIVLLENRDNVLPLSTDISSIALIGPQVNRVTVSIQQASLFKLSTTSRLCS